MFMALEKTVAFPDSPCQVCVCLVFGLTFSSFNTHLSRRIANILKAAFDLHCAQGCGGGVRTVRTGDRRVNSDGKIFKVYLGLFRVINNLSLHSFLQPAKSF